MEHSIDAIRREAESLKTKFGRYEAPLQIRAEVEEASKHLESPSKDPDWMSYTDYIEAQTRFEEIVRILRKGIEESIASAQKKTLNRLKLAFWLSFLWPLGIPPFISTSMWDWQAVIPESLNENIQPGWVIVGILLLPLTAIVGLFIFLVVLFSYRKNRNKLQERHQKEMSTELGVLPSPGTKPSNLLSSQDEYIRMYWLFRSWGIDFKTAFGEYSKKGDTQGWDYIHVGRGNYETDFVYFERVKDMWRPQADWGFLSPAYNQS